MTIDTTSAGMPPIHPSHDALDIPPVQAVRGAGPGSPPAVQSLIGEGKAQVASGLDGLAGVVRDMAAKLDSNGAAPLAKYIHDAADAVDGWSRTVKQKSVDDLLGDTRTLVRTSPALAVGIAVAAGFAVSRVVRSGR